MQGRRRQGRGPGSRIIPLLASIGLLAPLAASASFGAPPPNPPQPPNPFREVRVPSPDPQSGGRWGDRMATAGDLDGDGANDLWIGVYQHDLPGAVNAGRVYALSGRKQQLLYWIDSPEPQHEPPTRPAWAGFGWSVTNLGDVDGDGKNDLGAGSVRHDVYTGSGAPCGAPEPNGCNENQGKAWVFSGATGRLLYALDNPEPQGSQSNHGHFGWVGTAGDVTGDGVSEVLVGAEGNDMPRACADATPPSPGCRKDQGQAFIFNGVNGALLRTLDMPEEDRYLRADGTCQDDCGRLGIVAQGPGDVNGDGVADQLVSAWGYDPQGLQAPAGPNPTAPGRMYLYSGKDGSLLRRIDSPEPQDRALFGLQIVEPLAPGDVNGDGHADIYGNGFVHDVGANTAQGRAWVFDGKTGRALYTLDDPTPEPGGQFGYSLARTDHNGDGVPDLYVGSSPHHGAGRGTTQSGGTYLFDGRDGSLIASLELPAADVQPGTGDPGAGNIGPNLGRSVAAPGDLNRDKKPDYVAGAPNMDVAGNQDVGVVYFFLATARTSHPDHSNREAAEGRP
ncbi:MAG: integrin alpha [Actinomycetota bacterium]|nr:integrin alpha [Actinomycetota bacterium]